MTFNRKASAILRQFVNLKKGKRVRIELTDMASTSANNMVEVGGQKLDDGVARDDSKAKGTLSIIEVEIYEKAKD